MILLVLYIYMLCTLICSNCLMIACFCIPTIVIFLGMDIHKQQLFWGEQKGISRFDPQTKHSVCILGTIIFKHMEVS